MALYVILIIAGFVPSLLWLHFYLGKDVHPEPRRLIIETFFFGILLAPLAVAAQYLFGWAVGGPTDSLVFFFWAAFVEEAVKFLAVYYLIIHKPDFDEPIDAMIYLITAALGFAAIENILVLFKNIPDGVSITAQILVLRFFGATLLHALSSAIVGYFLALAWFHEPHRRKLIWFGIGAGTTFHFLFNILLLDFSALQGLLASTSVLVFMLILVSVLFHKLRERSESSIIKANA